ncbi:MAG: penicillin-binding protein 2 [Acidimicrobiales bacterium]|nr:penicillin-binding protein 2 [Acidimicrobiales bacterium]MCB1247773.1 penicillin-binding protein 2 [Acidimicrobiales bacterium]
MNRQIRQLGIFLVMCYLALFVKLNQVQFFGAEELNDHPLNATKVTQAFNRPRGSIVTADGVLLAESVPAAEDSQFDRQRVYPQGDLYGQVTGFFSFKYGASGVERSYNAELTGQTFQQQIDGLRDLLVDRDNVGDVRLSIRDDLQRLARDQLGQREGAVVTLDPRTGELLAFWSYPSFDPNLLSVENEEVVTATWDVLNAAPGAPLRAHQYQDRYFPGSTFKVVTAGAGLRTGTVSNTEPVYPPSSGYVAPQTNIPIRNFDGGACGGALPVILAQSCNTAFAEMGTETIGGPGMLDGAQAFGFNTDVPIDLPAPAQSAFPTDVASNPPKLAQASIGQNDVQATPLQMALVAAAVANGGKLMTPHVMREVRDRQGAVVTSYEPSTWLEPLDPTQAATLREDMIGVVTNGSGTAAQVPGFEIGGKTGTAQLGDGQRVHTWFIAFGGQPGQVPSVAVAVVVLNQPLSGTGGGTAAPIAQAMLSAALTNPAP